MTSSTSPLRTLTAGAIAGLALYLTMGFTFGRLGGPFILNPDLQSAKLIAVWTELEPLPVINTRPLLFGLGMMVIGIAHAIVYRGVRDAWPEGLLPRALRMAALTWLMTSLFFEYFTPFNLFGEPPWLVALELGFWAISVLVEAFVLVWLMER